jgi:hypothetical protein
MEEDVGDQAEEVVFLTTHLDELAHAHVLDGARPVEARLQPGAERPAHDDA